MVYEGRDSKDPRYKDPREKNYVDHSKSREKDPRQNYYEPDLHRDRSIDRNRDPDRAMDRNLKRDRTIDRDRERDRTMDRDRERDRTMDRERDRTVDRYREPDRIMGRSRERDKNTDRSREPDRNMDRNRERDKTMDRNRERDRTMERERDKESNRNRDNEIIKEQMTREMQIQRAKTFRSVYKIEANNRPTLFDISPPGYEATPVLEFKHLKATGALPVMAIPQGSTIIHRARRLYVENLPEQTDAEDFINFVNNKLLSNALNIKPGNPALFLDLGHDGETAYLEVRYKLY
uniref:Splicing factor U2AF 65 kDa subunit (Trinotate prediction) n=1 Tax=Henneguya salminicola TaxID=69463 RepID=A0A6G3MFD7_HENSL